MTRRIGAVAQRAVVPPAMTVQEWAALPEDEPGELVDGRLEDAEVPDAVHETVVLFLATLLRGWLAGGGFVLGSGVKYALAPKKGRMPDLSVFLPGGLVPPGRGPIGEPPDIAVEVVSSSADDRRRDRVEKLVEYARFGIRFYWLVDPAAKTLEILELGEARQYAIVCAASGGRVDRVPGCEGLAIDLDALWAELERLG